MFQTDLYLNFIDNSTMKFADVHPDNEYKIVNGLLSFESADGEEIHYVPAQNVKNFYTVCVRSN